VHQCAGIARTVFTKARCRAGRQDLDYLNLPLTVLCGCLVHHLADHSDGGDGGSEGEELDEQDAEIIDLSNDLEEEEDADEDHMGLHHHHHHHHHGPEDGEHGMEGGEGLASK
jgi:hypothetical protein